MVKLQSINANFNLFNGYSWELCFMQNIYTEFTSVFFDQFAINLVKINFVCRFQIHSSFVQTILEYNFNFYK